MIYKKVEKGDIRYYQIFGLNCVKVVNSKKLMCIYIFGFRILKRVKLKYLKSLTEKLVNEISIIRTENATRYEQLEKTINNLSKNIDNQCNVLRLNINNINTYSKAHMESFSGFKEKFLGQDIVILCTGPTLAKYRPIEKTINIGVNRAFRRYDISLDFIFIQDITGLKNDIDAINNYNPETCQKFYGSSITFGASIPEKDLIKANAKRYYVGNFFTDFYPDITSSVFPEYGSVVFSALTFALYTHPKRIYLVGCDACQNGYFDNDDQAAFSSNIDFLLNGWHAFKKFKDQFYPDVEIVSINPVGLKGVFKDVYQ
ncbi:MULTISPECIES: hypothetical protein [unclassified Gilliamella]|uniref:hypothetical protein n=1 Tax=unclassified Gilliamella TaxID=2685620 RepID=UPI00130A179D|nr:MULTISPECIES: hypothetical protein [unclassified Gilliamella]MWP48895.1 hypothetical protein [Gilliamella sp. Lep-s35]MWP68761.1 hypothetical protein [Gilliamella sp. Lep-s5]MWP77166.1 hypothetical protein [Gilliamella sp. Lep-s21]